MQNFYFLILLYATGHKEHMTSTEFHFFWANHFHYEDECYKILLQWLEQMTPFRKKKQTKHFIGLCIKSNPIKYSDRYPFDP